MSKRIIIRSVVAALATLLPLTAAGAGVAAAAPAPVALSGTPAPAASSPSPGVIPIGGGGFQYSNTEHGPDYCAISAIGVTTLANGYAQFQAQVISNIGGMAGTATVTWSGGSRNFDVIGTNWTSPLETVGGFKSGERVGFVLSFDNLDIGDPEGPSCGMPAPTVTFTYY